jgi:hypothetical protein
MMRSSKAATSNDRPPLVRGLPPICGESEELVIELGGGMGKQHVIQGADGAYSDSRTWCPAEGVEGPALRGRSALTSSPEREPG